MVALYFCLAAIAPGFAKTTITDLRCEGLDNPLGIDATQPRLSWISISDERGQRQTACQVLVASSLAKLKADQGDWWDSGRMESGVFVSLVTCHLSPSGSNAAAASIKFFDAFSVDRADGETL